MTQRTLQVIGRGVAALFLALGVSAQAQAAPISLGLTTSLPDIAASGIAITYDAGTDTFVAFSNAPLQLTPGFPFLGNSTYNLVAEIDAAGALVSGSLAITTTDATFPFAIQVALTQFGYNPAGVALLEFLGTITSDPQNVFGGNTAFGVIMNSTIANINFGASFNNFDDQGLGSATSDNFAVPEPATMGLLALGVLGFGLARRRRL